MLAEEPATPTSQNCERRERADFPTANSLFLDHFFLAVFVHALAITLSRASLVYSSSTQLSTNAQSHKISEPLGSFCKGQQTIYGILASVYLT